MFQLSRYYRHGELDACDEKWSDLWECFAVKRAQRDGLPAPERLAARARAETGEGDANGTSPLTREDAERAGRAWRKLFGANVPSERELRDAERETLANGRASERETSTFGGGTG